MTTSAHIRTTHGGSLAVGWAADRTLTVDRPAAAGGTGRGYSGGDLLLLAVGACYHNVLMREAALRGLAVERVEIDVRCEWSGEPRCAAQISVAVAVAADASDEAVHDLIRHVDGVAEIPATLRHGAEVALAIVRLNREQHQEETHL
jgi:putative redox protein